MANPLLKVGDRAPAFHAATDGGGEVSLADMAGKRFVLYFYSRDNTSGCTTEACDFRDQLARFRALGLEVVGASPDPVASHDRFKLKHELPFPLISDPEREIAESYGVFREKKRYGKVSKGIVRSTFVVGADGELERIYDNVRAKGHVERVLKDLEAAEG